MKVILKNYRIILLFFIYSSAMAIQSPQEIIKKELSPIYKNLKNNLSKENKEIISNIDKEFSKYINKFKRDIKRKYKNEYGIDLDQIEELYNMVRYNYLIERIPQYLQVKNSKSLLYYLKEDAYHGYYFVMSYLNKSSAFYELKSELNNRLQALKASARSRKRVLKRLN